MGKRKHSNPALTSFGGDNSHILSGHTRKGYATIASEMEEPPRNPYPYPSHHRPTAHQIFHLPLGATQEEIKARYYDLVRTHHPDSPHTRLLTPTTAHARFRNIKAAYDFLRGHTLSPHPNARPAPSPQNFDPYLHELARRRRAWEASSGRSQHRSHSHSSTWDAGYDGGDNSSFAGAGAGWAKPGWGEGFGAPVNERSQWNPDGKRERIVLALGVVTLLAGLFPDLPGTIGEVFFVSSGVGSEEAPKKAGDVSVSPSAVEGPSSPSPSASDSTQRPATTPNPPSLSSFSIPNPFIPPDKAHRTAVAALRQVRQERTEMGLGVERREGIRQRVKEIKVEDKDGMNGESKVQDSGEGLKVDNIRVDDETQTGNSASSKPGQVKDTSPFEPTHDVKLTDTPNAASRGSPDGMPRQSPIMPNAGIEKVDVTADVAKVAHTSTSGSISARVADSSPEEEALA